VDDPLARSPMLLPELFDDLRPRRRLVAEHAPSGPVHERVDHLERKAVRVRGHCLGRDDPHQLPVTRRRVLAFRTLDEPPRFGLIGLNVFCTAVMSLAAGVTWLVVKICPSGSKKKKPEPQAS